MIHTRLSHCFVDYGPGNSKYPSPLLYRVLFQYDLTSSNLKKHADHCVNRTFLHESVVSFNREYGVVSLASYSTVGCAHCYLEGHEGHCRPSSLKQVVDVEPPPTSASDSATRGFHSKLKQKTRFPEGKKTSHGFYCWRGWQWRVQGRGMVRPGPTLLRGLR